jgi:hypothetical protein
MSGDENDLRSAILNRMTQTKRPVLDANPKAVESWDNEGGAPASGDRSSEFATAEFPIAVSNEGFAAQNEAAALRSALRLAENLTESIRRRLGLEDI